MVNYACPFSQSELGLGYYGINKTRPHIARNSTLKLKTFSNFVFIGPTLNEIQPFKNAKI